MKKTLTLLFALAMVVSMLAVPALATDDAPTEGAAFSIQTSDAPTETPVSPAQTPDAPTETPVSSVTTVPADNEGDETDDTVQTEPEHVHEWTEWETDFEANCSRGTIEMRYCKTCHEEEQRTVGEPNGQHLYLGNIQEEAWMALIDFQGAWVVDKIPTCTEEGHGYHTCAVCKQYEETTISKLPHQWGDWEVTTPATEDAVGVETRTCSVCGGTETCTIAKLSGSGSQSDVPQLRVINEGTTTSWTPNEDQDLTFHVDNEPEKLDGVYIDNELVDEENYVITRGSTIVTFKDSFLKTLANGEHSIKMAFTDGEANMDFTVTNNEPANSNTQEKPAETKPSSEKADTAAGKSDKYSEPKTGDETSVVGWSAMMALCVILTVAVMQNARKRGLFTNK